LDAAIGELETGGIGDWGGREIGLSGDSGTDSRGKLVKGFFFLFFSQKQNLGSALSAVHVADQPPISIV
jgi:hypothetical protein